MALVKKYAVMFQPFEEEDMEYVKRGLWSNVDRQESYQDL